MTQAGLTDATRGNATPLLPARATADGTHRRILEAALVRFGERGFHGVSVREIAEAAGVRASSVYAHLESKEQLLFQLMLIGHEEHHECLRLALLEAGSDPIEQVTELARAHVRMHATYPLMARVANREMAALSPESKQRILDVRRSSASCCSPTSSAAACASACSTSKTSGSASQPSAPWASAWPSGGTTSSASTSSRSPTPTPDSRCAC